MVLAASIGKRSACCTSRMFTLLASAPPASSTAGRMSVQTPVRGPPQVRPSIFLGVVTLPSSTAENAAHKLLHQIAHDDAKVRALGVRDHQIGGVVEADVDFAVLDLAARCRPSRSHG